VTNDENRNVAYLVTSQRMQLVPTTQVAPAIIQGLGLHPGEYQGMEMEGTKLFLGFVKKKFWLLGYLARNVGTS
jgi:hypothetical protein